MRACGILALSAGLRRSDPQALSRRRTRSPAPSAAGEPAWTHRAGSCAQLDGAPRACARRPRARRGALRPAGALAAPSRAARCVSPARRRVRRGLPRRRLALAARTSTGPRALVLLVNRPTRAARPRRACALRLTNPQRRSAQPVRPCDCSIRSRRSPGDPEPRDCALCARPRCGRRWPSSDLRRSDLAQGAPLVGFSAAAGASAQAYDLACGLADADRLRAVAVERPIPPAARCAPGRQHRAARRRAICATPPQAPPLPARRQTHRCARRATRARLRLSAASAPHVCTRGACHAAAWLRRALEPAPRTRWTLQSHSLRRAAGPPSARCAAYGPRPDQRSYST